jgi:hypothetical protein
LKPVQANSSRDPILKKKKSQKRAGGVAQSVGPESKSQYYTHKKNHHWREGVAQAVVDLQNKYKALNSNPSTAKKNHR